MWPVTEEALDELVELAQAGDRAALGELLRLTQDRMYGTILRIVGNADDAQELTQDTLIRVIQHLDRYDHQCRVTTWMTRIAINLSISFLRKRKLRRHASLDGGGRASPGAPRGGDSVASSCNSNGYAGSWGSGGGEQGGLLSVLSDERNRRPDQNVQSSEMIENLHKAMERLDEDTRIILIMRDFNQMDYQEIAGSLRIALGTVKSRLFRARMALRAELEALMPQVAADVGRVGPAPAGRPGRTGASSLEVAP
ncbi:MAG: sigma-70 family RNA polymerase sigma factor [Phycisphaeraceae bacterium]|nr:sigma-70 family RNA polymerase sigma factor [Phycisphaeraceae bacterium]